MLCAALAMGCEEIGPTVGPGGAVGGERLRPLPWLFDDGSSAMSGRWEDTERDEICSIVELPDGSARCLPPHRSQLGMGTVYAGSGCDGAPVSRSPGTGYILDDSTGVLYVMTGPAPEAWKVAEGDCIPAGEGPWYAWSEIPLSAFVSADLAP